MRSLALALCACGQLDAQPSAPPAYDVTGTWVGTLDSTTPRGEPVYGPYTATLYLTQSNAAVTGAFRADIRIAGSIDAGYVTANRLTLQMSTLECPGSMRLSATVRAEPDGRLVMDVDSSGKTECAGEREEKGTLVRQ